MGSETRLNERIAAPVHPETVRIGPPFTVAELPACQAAQALHLGSWDTVLFSYDRLNEWLAARGMAAVPL